MKKKAKKKPARGGVRPGAGRPSTGKVQRSIRCDPEQWERWRRAAERTGKSLHEWLRDLADREAAKAER